MKELNKKQIALIDDYLKTLNLKHYEERLEFTDHIASYIESEFSKNPDVKFYDVLYDYLTEHKTEIQHNGKKFRRSAFKQVLIRTLKNLFHPIVFLLGFVLFFIYRQLPLKQWDGSLGPFWLIGAIGLALVLRLFFENLKHKKYLMIDTLNSIALYVIFYPFLFKPWIDFMSIGDQILMRFIFWMGTAIIFTSLKVSTEYTNRFEIA